MTLLAGGDITSELGDPKHIYVMAANLLNAKGVHWVATTTVLHFAANKCGKCIVQAGVSL